MCYARIFIMGFLKFFKLNSLHLQIQDSHERCRPSDAAGNPAAAVH